MCLHLLPQRSVSEKYLKANNNNIDAALGDLLAVTALGEEEPPNGTLPFNNLQNKRRGSKHQLVAPGQPTPHAPLGSVMGSTTTSAVGSTSSLGLGLKDPMYQQLAALQAQIFPPMSGQQSQALQNQLIVQQMQLMQMQRYLLGGGGGGVGGIFPGMPNLQNYQQLLTQQLGQFQLYKQQLQQFKLSAQASQSASHQQMVSMRLSFINQSIAQINQQLVLLSQISSQQKDAAKNQDGKLTPVGLGSPQIGRSTPPIRPKADFKMAGGIPLRAQSANSLSSLGGASDLTKGMAYGMQNLSLNPQQNASQSSSARSVSRLQQIISGSASSDNLTGLAERQAMGVPAPPLGAPGAVSRPHSVSSPCPVASTPTIGSGSSSLVGPGAPPSSSTMSPMSSGTIVSSSTATTASSVPPFHSQKSVEDIQEFRPGVPWQPRTQPTEPAQVYAKPTAQPSGFGPTSNPKFQSLAKSGFSSSFSTSFVPSSGMMSRAGENKPYRHNSVGSTGSFYPSPTSTVPPIGSHTKYGREGRPSWNTPAMPDGRGMPPYGQHQGHTHPTRRASQGSTLTRNIPGPFRPSYPSFPGPGSQAPFGGRKHPNRTLSHPSMPMPTGNYPPVPYPGSTAGYGGSHAPAQYASTQKYPGHKWGSSFGEVQHTSNAAWGSSAARQGWGQDDAPVWAHTLTTTRNQRTTSDDTSPPSTTSPSDRYSLPPTSQPLESFSTASNATWGQDGLRSPHFESSMLSPEPTFAEWQAGKKARLSVFKLPSNPPSNWLLLRNVTPQVSWI